MQMPRLILTEKPSVALEFARVLGAQKRLGYYQNPSGDAITYCWGHLIRLLYPEEYDPSLKEWSVESLPVVPEQFRFAQIPEASRQLATIKFLLRQKPSQIIIATDAGREGELIARETLKWCGLTDFSNVYRFWTSRALTPEAIEANLRDLKPASRYTPLYLSAYYRMRSDWLVGMNFTRLFTVKLGSLFSFGRVQIPLLSALVENTQLIRQFEPQPYYGLRLTLSKDNHSFFAHFTKDGYVVFREKNKLPPTAFPDRREMESTRSRIHKSKQTVTTLAVSYEQKIVQPPELYNLTTLQKDCARFFGYRAAQTECIAQALYQDHKVLSYPRTASRVLSRADHPFFCNLVTKLNFHHPEVFRNCVLPSVDNARIFDDAKLSDHHALLILDKLPPTLTPEQRNVATLILKSMAAVLMSPYIYNAQHYLFDLLGLHFESRGQQTVSQGWKQLFLQEHGDADSSGRGHGLGVEESFDSELPPVREGEALSVSGSDILDRKTRPPRPFNEARILSFMDKYRLGTESTRAEILETIIKRRYALRAKSFILASNKGSFFIQTLRSLSVEHVKDFVSVQETSTWEAMLESAPQAFYTSIKLALEGAIDSLKQASLSPYQDKPVGNCPHCGKPLHEGEFAYSCRSEDGCQFSISKVIKGHTLTENDISLLLKGIPTRLATFTANTGREFKARLRYDCASRVLVWSYPYQSTGGHR